MKFAAFGRTQLLYDSIRVCAAAGHQPVLLGTAPPAPEYTRSEKDFESLAREMGCPYFCDAKINRPQYLDLMASASAEVAFSVNWPTLIGRDVLDRFAHGVINAHAGDLPRFRGNACPNWAILTGEKKIVVTLHRMAEALDAGPILLQESFPVTPETYIGDFYRFAQQRIPRMFARALKGLEEGDLHYTEQPHDPALSLRCFPRMPADGLIDWEMPAEQISRLVRASSEPFSGAFTYLGRERLIVWRARAGRLPYPYLGVPGHVVEVNKAAGESSVLAGDGIVVLEEIETASTGRVRASKVLTSTKIRLGIDPSAVLDNYRS